MGKSFRVKASLFLVAFLIITGSALAQWNFHTDYFKIHINQKGYITGMQDITVEPNREFSPPGKPSPLLCLYSSGEDQYYYLRKRWMPIPGICTGRTAMVPVKNYL